MPIARAVERADGADRDGRGRRRVAGAGDAVRIVLDLRGRRRCARAGRRVATAREFAFDRSAATRRSTASSVARSHIRCRRRCTTPRFAAREPRCRVSRRLPPPTSTTFSTFAEAMPIDGASVTAPFKVDAFEVRVPNPIRVGRSDSVGQHVASERRPVDCVQHRRRRVSRAIAGDGTVQGRRSTVLGAGGAARAVG